MCGRALHPAPPLCRAWQQRKPARHRLPSGCCRDTVADGDEIGSAKTTEATRTPYGSDEIRSKGETRVSLEDSGSRKRSGIVFGCYQWMPCCVRRRRNVVLITPESARPEERTLSFIAGIPENAEGEEVEPTCRHIDFVCKGA